MHSDEKFRRSECKSRFKSAIAKELIEKIAGISARFGARPVQRARVHCDTTNEIARYQIRTSEVRCCVVGSNRYVLLGLECNKRTPKLVERGKTNEAVRGGARRWPRRLKIPLRSHVPRLGHRTPMPSLSNGTESPLFRCATSLARAFRPIPQNPTFHLFHD